LSSPKLAKVMSKRPIRVLLYSLAFGVLLTMAQGSLTYLFERLGLLMVLFRPISYPPLIWGLESLLLYVGLTYLAWAFVSYLLLSLFISAEVEAEKREILRALDGYLALVPSCPMNRPLNRPLNEPLNISPPKYELDKEEDKAGDKVGSD